MRRQPIQLVIAGCLRFRGTPALQKRDPKLATLLMVTSAVLDEHNLFNIEMTGRVGELKLRAASCKTS